jgi:glycosyltransferase involved in cell wall biosynthesis
MPTLSLCAIMKNESTRIEEFIDRNSEWCDEIVLVDTGSTDDTLKRAANKRVTVWTKPWNNDFSSVRNYGLEKATSDWIVLLDCDEYIDEPFRDVIRKAIDVSTVEHAYCMPIATVQGSQITLTARTSLFRNHPLIRFDGLVHEQVIKSIRKAGFLYATLDAPIYHLPPIGGNEKKKNEFYRSLLKLEVSSDPSNPRVNYFLGMDALTKMADIQLALRYYINGLQGEVSKCEWPVEYILNALSAARLLRSTNPSSSLELLQKALDAKSAFQHDPAVSWIRESNLEVQAMYFDLMIETKRLASLAGRRGSRDG